MKKFNKINNKGFSLVELIIAITLLVVVAIACGMLMSSGSDLFSSVNGRENLQYKSQIALSQMKTYLACADAIMVNGESKTTGEIGSDGETTQVNEYTKVSDITVVARDRDANVSYCYKFIYNEENKEITMQRHKYVIDGNRAVLETTEGEVDTAPVISSVIGFKALLQGDGIKISLTFEEKGRKNYTKAYVINFIATKATTICTDEDAINEICGNKNKPET